MLEILLTSPYVQEMLAPGMKAELTKYGLILAVMWAMMGKKVSRHFERIEEGLRSVARELAKFQEMVSRDLETHKQRFTSVENKVTDLQDRVVILEKQNQ